MARPKTFETQETLAKAMELFWKQGYHATSIQNLVDYLGINRASIYATYGDKQTLFNQAFALYRESYRKAILALFDNQESIKQGFRELFAKAVDSILEDPEGKGCFAINTITELSIHHPALQEVLIQNKEAYEDLYMVQLQIGQETGEIAPDKDLRATARFLFSLYSGLQVIAKLNPTRENLEHVVSVGLSVMD